VKLEHAFGDVQSNDLQAGHLTDDLPRALGSTTMHDETSLMFVKTLVYQATGTLIPYPFKSPARLANKHTPKTVTLFIFMLLRPLSCP
jgi:hypothetical protein